MNGMLAKLFRRFFSSGPHATSIEVRHHALFNYRETWLVGDIAFKDALELGQELTPVHVLGAAMYRLRDADPELAARLSISFLHVRRWAMENLPSRRQFHVESPALDYDYTVFEREFRGIYQLMVGRVNRPVRRVVPETAEPVGGSEHRPGVGSFIAVPPPEPVNRDRTEMAFGLLASCDNPGETPELTIVTIRRILTRFLDDQQVQDCIAAHGVTPQRFLAELGTPPD